MVGDGVVVGGAAQLTVLRSRPPFGFRVTAARLEVGASLLPVAEAASGVLTAAAVQRLDDRVLRELPAPQRRLVVAPAVHGHDLAADAARVLLELAQFALLLLA